MGQLWSRSRAAALVTAVTMMTGCEATLKEGININIQDFVASVTDASGTIHATLVPGEAPNPNGGPSASIAGVAVMINGGTSQQTVTGGANFTRVIVAVAGMQNYYELTLPASAASEGILIGANPAAYAGQLNFQYAVGDAGTLGNYASQSMRFLRVGTGDIQISVAWSDSSDVDLHVVDPNGEEIYFGHKTAASGGILDLDANAACSMNELPDHSHAYVSNENVVWASGMAIPGTYKVVLDYWSACGSAQTDYVVTVQRVGAQPQIFTGTFVGSGAADDTVTVFTH